MYSFFMNCDPWTADFISAPDQVNKLFKIVNRELFCDLNCFLNAAVLNSVVQDYLSISCTVTFFNDVQMEGIYMGTFANTPVEI